MKKSIAIFLILLFVIASITACQNDFTSFDIITQKPLSSEKIDITVMVKYAFSINTFEKDLEEKFPNINIIQVGNYSGNMGKDEYEARIKNDDLTDIVMTWPLEVGQEYWEDRLLDLSTLSLTRNYTTKSLNEVSVGQNGKVYYLPGPSQVRGIVYNKTLFEENNWQVPNDFESFIDLCKTIEGSGMRSLQLGLGNKEVYDTAFVGYGYGDCYANPDNALALEKYNQGNGSFGDNFLPALETFKRLVDEDILKPSDTNVYYSDRERMLFNRECAMVEDSVLLARMGESIAGTKDEFALMPFFNQGQYNDWARLYPVCFIGLNKHLTDTGNTAKYQAALQVLEYLSTPEGQKSLAGDTGAMFSNLKGMSAPDDKEIADMQTALNAGRYGIFPTLKNAQDTLRSGLEGLLQGKMTINEVIKAVDKQNMTPQQKEEPQVIGQASEDFTLMETSQYFTDVMQSFTKSDIALILDNGKDGRYNGKGLSGRLYEGDITVKDIMRIMPDTKYGEKGEIWIVKMTGAGLIRAIEETVKVDNDIGGWFYYFSGLKIKFNPYAPVGDRIISIQDSHGKAIIFDKIYTVAVTDESIDKKFILEYQEKGMSLKALIEKSIEKEKIISPKRDGRFIVV